MAIKVVSIQEIPLEEPFVFPSRMWEVKLRNGRRVGTFHIASGQAPITDYSEAGLLNLLYDYADDRHIDPVADLEDYDGMDDADLLRLMRNGQHIYDELQRIGL